MLRKLSEGQRRTIAHWGMEFVIVLTGVLLALWLQEWAASRNDAAKHHELMERLFEEAQEDVTATRMFRDILNDLTRNEIAFATSLSRGECPPSSMWNAVETVEMLPAFNAPRSVYQELMGAGGLSAIEHAHVRTAIAQFNMALDWAQKQNEYFRSKTFQHQPVSDSDPAYSLRFDLKQDEPQVATFERETLCRDKGFRNRMVAATRIHYVAYSYHAEVTDRAIAMCAVLGDSIGRRCEPSGGPLSGKDLELARRAIATARKS